VLLPGAVMAAGAAMAGASAAVVAVLVYGLVTVICLRYILIRFRALTPYKISVTYTKIING
jgi:hypothetical protein